jgi:phosphinothricin acetyltransferase
MPLSSPSTVLRSARLADAAAIQAIYAPYVRDTCISFEAEPPSVGEMEQRIAKILARWPWLVCEQGGEVVAYAYAGEHRVRAAFRWAVDVAVYVRQDQQRRGHGRLLYGRLLPLLRRQGFYHAYAAIYVPNPGSVALHEAMGFRPCALFPKVGFKFGDWRDVGWWHLALQPLPAEPAEPRPPGPIDLH